jgi:hypothetical protein
MRRYKKFMALNWKTSASGMQLTQSSDYTYTISGGDGGYYTLGRTSAQDGVMVVLGKQFVTAADAQAAAETDYEKMTAQPTTTS